MHPACLLLLLLPLGGCVAAGALGAAEATSVAVFGRGIVDLGVSGLSGRDCSIVRLDRGETYCAEREHLPAPLPYCARTLGTVQCWLNPEAFASLPRQVADTPALTVGQARQIEARWPKSLN